MTAAECLAQACSLGDAYQLQVYVPENYLNRA